MTRVVGEEHPHTLTSMGNLAGNTLGARRSRGGRAAWERVLEVTTACWARSTRTR